MKKIAIASAIALASITAAHAAPTVYGKVLLTGEYTDVDDKTSKNDDTSSTKLVSNYSRIGFKGEDDLTDTTKLVYQLEYGIDLDADNNGKGQFYSRNTYLGLAHNTLGTVLAGRHDTPYKLAKGSVDVFNDYDNVGLGNLMVGEQRANNVIAYKSPTLVGTPVTFLGAVSLDECSKNDDDKCLVTAAVPATGTTPAKPAVYRDKKNAYSAMVNYDQNGVYIGLGYDNSVYGNDTSGWRLAGSLDMGKMNMVDGLTLGALYQDYDFNTDDNEQSWLLSGKYKVGATPWAVKAQYIDTSNQSGVKDNDATEVALGAEYSFNKATKGHLYAAQIDTDNVSDKTIVGGGLEYKF
ncbi:porin [Moraxella osloensis]|uniref:Porin n=1 Tax=Faucicola osloensis TaxID=34062 RepID=A0A6P1KAJ2_FAUOS|nr:porin [Moraxella osloensis]QHG08818.1 porin [Moraxella osloensis]